MAPSPSSLEHDTDSHVGSAAGILVAWPLLLSVLLLMVGAGLQGSLLGIRAEAESFDTTVTGGVLGLYYLGYVVGSSVVPTLIRSVGHIRVFASFASVASATVILHGIWITPLVWMGLRFVTGVCIAGLFVVTESWLAASATPTTRGTILAAYNSIVVLGLAIGSIMLNAADTDGIVLFVIGSVLLSMAAVPVTLAPHEAPVPHVHEQHSFSAQRRAAPLGFVSAALSGLVVAGSLGFGAVYALRAGLGVGGASQFLTAILVGGVVLQVPLGRWSDRTDRRIVMGAAAVLVSSGAAVGLLADQRGSFVLVLVAAVAIGGGGFSLYGLGFAHLADRIEPAALTSAGARLMSVNGVAAATGPLLAALFLRLFGTGGFFYLPAGASGLFVAYVLYRLAVRRREAQRASYAPLASSATLASVEEVGSEVVGVDLAELWQRRRRERLARLAPRPRIRRTGPPRRSDHPD